MSIDTGEPLTPTGRMFVQPAMNQIINCVLGLDHSVDIDLVRSVISNSLIVKHPRFTSLLVKDKHGCACWKQVELELDQHIIYLPDVVSANTDDETAVNEYLADLTVSCPLSTDKPLWEVHILGAHKCVVMRFHHALGDGVSLLSLMLTMGRNVSDNKVPNIQPLISSTSNRSKENGLWKVMKMMLFTSVYMFEFMMRSLWVRDKETVVRGGAGVELWPRKMATAKFSLDDLKTVKSAVANTVSFIFC